MMTKPTAKLYLLTNDDEFDLLYQKLAVALATGVIGLLQIRRKKVLAQIDGQKKLESEARQIINLAKQYQVPVLINDDIDLAAKLGVGVHLGQSDGSISDAKAKLGSNAIIGRTCHGDVDLVTQAKIEGATYAAMGAVFASATKPKAATISIDALEQGINRGIDICIIGGLTAENISQLSHLAIAYVAVVGDIMELPVSQIAKRCEEWQRALQSFAKT